MAKKKASKKTTEVAKKEENTDLAVYNEAYGTEDIDNEDIIIPKILMMQGMSKLVTEGKAKLGDMVDSLTSEVLGDVNNAIEFIPFKTFKTWIIFHDEEYKETVPLTPANKGWPIEDTVDGVDIRRDKVFNVYCLLPEQIEKGDFLPYVLSFRRTSYYTGRKLATAFARLKMYKKPAFAKVFKLTANKQQKDKHTYFSFDLEQVGDSSNAQMKECKMWYDVVKGKAVDNSEQHKDAPTPTGTTQAMRDLGPEEQGFNI